MRHARSVALAAALSAAAANAATLDRPSLRQLVDEAELVFEGVVTDVTYRNSIVLGPEDAELPHAFVTFDILRAFKGRSQMGSRFVLRLQGGPDGHGLRLWIPGIPDFSPGDREILFVKANGEDECPLVGWEHGRFLLADGAVLRGGRDPVWLDADDELTGAPADLEPPPGSRAAAPEQFGGIVRRRVGERYSREALDEIPAMRSVDPGQAFRVQHLPPMPPPADPAAARSIGAPDAERRSR